MIEILSCNTRIGGAPLLLASLDLGSTQAGNEFADRLRHFRHDDRTPTPRRCCQSPALVSACNTGARRKTPSRIEHGAYLPAF